jgi:hypothetical protein
MLDEDDETKASPAAAGWRKVSLHAAPEGALATCDGEDDDDWAAVAGIRGGRAEE